MAGVMSGYNKVDIAVVGASSDYTSPYYDMSGYEKAIFICSMGSMNSSEYVGLRLYQAVTSTGGSAQLLNINTTVGSTTALACDINSAVAIYLDNASSMLTTQTIVVNGVTFTASNTETTGTFSTGRLFQSSSDGGKTTQCIEHLAAYINHATYGCTGLIVYPAATSLTITSLSGQKAVTVQLGTSTGLLMYPTRSIGILECHAADLASASSMRYLAVCSTASVAGAITKQSAVVIRCGARYTPETTAQVSGYAFGTT